MSLGSQPDLLLPAGPYLENSSSSSTITLNEIPALPTLIRSPLDAPRLKLSGRIIHALPILPYTITTNTTTTTTTHVLKRRRDNSALHAALAFINGSASSTWDNVIVGLPGDTDAKCYNYDDAAKAKIETDLLQLKSYGKMYPVWVNDKNPSTEQAWRHYAHEVLKPILQDENKEPICGFLEKEEWASYTAMNQAYAEKIKSIYLPGDLIWVHDYGLFMLPQLLRSTVKFSNGGGNDGLYIGLYMHSAFPSSEIFRKLAHRKELLEGILCANVVATQCYAFTRHFVSACARILGVETTPKYVCANGRKVAVDTIPLGIDAKAVEEEAFTSEVTAEMDEIRKKAKGKKIIVARERESQGLLKQLIAFQTFLIVYPEWQGKTTLMLVPSTGYGNHAEAGEILAIVEEIEASCNTSVLSYPFELTRAEYLALLRVADVGLIAGIQDSLNTTAQEFVICQKGSHAPLMLSESASVASTLVDAKLVHLWDPMGTAKQIGQTLSQVDGSAEKSAVYQKLYDTVHANTVQKWVWRFISRQVRTVEDHTQKHRTPALDAKLMKDRYNKAGKRTFLFDYDGSLTPIVRDPAAALPSDRLKQILKALVSDPCNRVWIVSGRDGEFLDKILGDIGKLGFSAEHGCFLKSAPAFDSEEPAVWTNLAQQADMSWQTEVRKIFEYFTEETQGSSIEYKHAALTWHYRRADPEFGAYQAKECFEYLMQTVGQKYEVEVMAGKANVEVRPRQFNKGEIIKSIVEREKPEFVMCIGDDLTDEDMFKVLASRPVELGNDDDDDDDADDLEEERHGAFTVKIGPANMWTAANYNLLDPAAVLDTLSVLTGLS